MRGRKPKPNENKRNDGTRKSRINEREPKVEGLASPPDYLDGVARKEWDRIAPILEGMRVLTAADSPTLALYCQAHSDYLDALGHFKDGKTVSTTRGGVKASPYVQIAKDARAEMLRLLIEFGCTPSSRGRLTTTGPAEADEFDDFLNRGKDSA